MTPDHAAGPRPAAVQPEPATVALADVTWARWGPLIVETPRGQPWQRHRRVVEFLLSGSGAALRRTPRGAEPHPWVEAGTPDGAATLDELVDGLAVSCRDQERGATGPAESEAALGRYAHRVHLPTTGLEQLLGAHGTAAPGEHACVDFGFGHHLGFTWLHTTLWLWSDRPESSAFTPPGPDGSPPGSCSPGELHDRFRALAEAFRAHLLDELVSISPTVLDESDRTTSRRYRAPRFWVVLRATGEGPDRHPTVDRLCRIALGAPGPGSPAVAADTLEARDSLRDDPVPIDVLRTMTPQPGGPVPIYLLSPAGTAGRGDREQAVDRLVDRLTRVETATAAHLLDVTTELDIDHSYGRLYAALARKGALLWDDLALNLPLRQGAELDHLHRLIELVHLTLLQGLADLQQLQTSAARTVAGLHTVPDEALDGLDAEYVGVEATGGLTESLRSGGYTGPARRWADGVARGTDDVVTQVTALLAAISHAFDERRVRDTDRIGRAGLLLAIGLGTVGFVTETYGNVLGDTSVSPWLFAGTVVALVVAAEAGRRRWVRRNGDLATTPRFRRLYRRVSDFAALCRAEKLEGVHNRAWAVAQLETTGDGLRERYGRFHAYWDDTDRHLAELFAGIVDDLSTAQRGNLDTDDRDVRARVEQRSSGPPDLHGLRARVEQWALVALLVAERPRSFYAYPLPRLTLLCRFVPFPSQGIALGDPADAVGSLVADADLLLTLRGNCGAELAHLATVTAWGAALTREVESGSMTATRMLAEIDRTGLRAGMNRAEWNEVHRTILDLVRSRDLEPGDVTGGEVVARSDDGRPVP